MKRVRLDRLLVQRGLAQSRERARDAIEAGEVTVGGIVVKKVASQVATDAAVALVAEPMRFVSRGGLKLEQALDAFDVPVSTRSRWTSAPLRAASPIACFSEVRRASTPST